MKRNDWFLALALGAAAAGTTAGVYLAMRAGSGSRAEPLLSQERPRAGHAQAQVPLAAPDKNREALPSTVAPPPEAAVQPAAVRERSPAAEPEPEPADETPPVFTAEQHEQYKQVYGGHDRDGLLKARDALRERFAREQSSRQAEGRSLEGDPDLAAMQREIEWLEQQVGR